MPPGRAASDGSNVDGSVVVETTGRIGNQLFMIAAGYAAARLSDRPLQVDLSAYSGPDARFSAEVLGFDWTFDDRISFGEFPRRGFGRYGFRGATKAQNTLSRLTFGATPATLRAAEVGHEPRLESAARYGRLIGYFQSAAHVQLACDLGLPRKLSVPRPSAWLTDVEQRAAEESPLVVVVRLGNYRKHHHVIGLLGPDYFREALARVDDPSRRIWLVCDELEAGLEFLPAEARERTWVVPQPAGLPKEQILLGAAAGRDYVIANSTFAWWAAWMSGEGSRVVAPRPWLRTRPVEGILPDAWEAIAPDW